MILLVKYIKNVGKDASPMENAESEQFVENISNGSLVAEL